MKNLKQFALLAACAVWVLQRPALLIGQNGTPTHLFAPCGTLPEGRTSTATFLFEIRNSNKD